MKSKIFMLLALSCIAFSVESNLTPQTNVMPEPAPQTPANMPNQTPPAPYPQHNYGLPPKIMQTINQMYPGVYVRDIDYEAYGYEVELSNRMELFFDREGKLLGQKYDY